MSSPLRSETKFCPQSHPDVPSPDSTHPIRTTTQVICRPESARISNIASAPLSNGEPFSCPQGPRRLPLVAHYALVDFQIYPDPPSLIMKDSNQTLRRCSAPSLCLSESTRLPPSVNARPSVRSLSSSSDGHTAVSFYAGTGSWYLPDDLQAEWDLGLQKEKKTASGSKEANGQTDLPMHYVSASRLRKTTKRRSCSGVLWNAMTSFGRGIVSLFDTSPATS